MENPKKKRKWSMKRIKRIFMNVLKEFKNSFKEMVNRFNKLPKHIKNICCVWAVVVLLIILIVICSTGNKKFIGEYNVLEDKLTEATLKYVNKAKIYPVKDSKLKLDLNTLEEYGNLVSGDLRDKKCDGFTLTYYDEKTEEYVIKPYIKCDKYVTKEFNDYK